MVKFCVGHHGAAQPPPWPGVTPIWNDSEPTPPIGSAAHRRARMQARTAPRPGTAVETTDASEESWMLTSGARVMAGRQTDPSVAVRLLDIWGWLMSVSFDSRRVTDNITRAIDSRPPQQRLGDHPPPPPPPRRRWRRDGTVAEGCPLRAFEFCGWWISSFSWVRPRPGPNLHSPLRTPLNLPADGAW